MGDAHGNLVHLFERECSMQRRFQKIVEETPSPALRSGAAERICETAAGIARAAGYRDAGTVEFLVRQERRVLFPRDEHAAPGRASGHRGDHRPQRAIELPRNSLQSGLIPTSEKWPQGPGMGRHLAFGICAASHAMSSGGK